MKKLQKIFTIGLCFAMVFTYPCFSAGVIDTTGDVKKTGFEQQADGTWKYYVKKDNDYIYDDWKKVDGKTYYFDENGTMLTGIHEVEGKYCKFDSNGAYVGEASEVEWAEYQGNLTGTEQYNPLGEIYKEIKEEYKVIIDEHNLQKELKEEEKQQKKQREREREQSEREQKNAQFLNGFYFQDENGNFTSVGTFLNEQTTEYVEETKDDNISQNNNTNFSNNYSNNSYETYKPKKSMLQIAKEDVQKKQKAYYEALEAEKKDPDAFKHAGFGSGGYVVTYDFNNRSVKNRIKAKKEYDTALEAYARLGGNRSDFE